MLPDRVSNPGPLTYESGALPIALHGPATTSLVNETLKFQTLISQICQYFLLKKKCGGFCSAKASLIFPTKNISAFGNEVAKYLTR